MAFVSEVVDAANATMFNTCMHQTRVWIQPPYLMAVSRAVGPAPEAQTAEWVQKHRPQGLKDIAVAKKKVQEAQQWLEAFRDGRPNVAHPRMLLLTGGSGSRPVADGECACSMPARPTLRLQWPLRCH